MENNRKAAAEDRRRYEEEQAYRRQLAEEQEKEKQELAATSRPPPSVDDDLFAIFDKRSEYRPTVVLSVRLRLVAQPSTSNANLNVGPSLDDWPLDSSQMQRNASAPSLDGGPTQSFDPLGDFLASSASTAAAAPPPPPPPRHSSAASPLAGGRSTSATRPAPPQHRAGGAERVNFESFFGNDKAQSSGRAAESAFDDLLNEQGFLSTAKNAQRSLADIKRVEENKTLDPVTIKVCKTFTWIPTCELRLDSRLDARQRA